MSYEYDSITLNAAADYSAKVGYAVTLTGAVTAPTCTLGADPTVSGGEVFAGIIAQDGGNTAGKPVHLVRAGRTLAVAGAAITFNTQELMYNSVGKLIPATVGSTVCAHYRGEKAGASAAATYWIEVDVEPHPYVKRDALNVTLGMTAGAEDTNVITVACQAKDSAGNSIAEAVEFELSGFEATGIEAVVGALRLAETGAGAEVTTTANSRLFITTSAAGVATVTVTDQAGASGKTFHIVATPIGRPGYPSRLAVTFD